MPAELVLRKSVSQKIEERSERLHRDLGNPDPPISLDAIRELLSLDKAFYSREDPGLLNKIVHKLKIAGLQVLAQPTRLLTAWQKWDIKALWVPDIRRIILDESIPEKKKRWAETHEIGHSILPWHQEFLQGDPDSTLSVSCNAKIESEANYAAGQILFPKRVFRETLPEISQINMSAILKIAKSFGNSVTSTLWRTVETLDVPSFGFICENPCTSLPAFITQNISVKEQPRHFFRSNSFAERFSSITDDAIWNYLQSNCKPKKWKLLDTTVNIPANDQIYEEFHIETLNLTHYAATFAIRHM